MSKITLIQRLLANVFETLFKVQSNVTSTYAHR